MVDISCWMFHFFLLSRAGHAPAHVLVTSVWVWISVVISNQVVLLVKISDDTHRP